MLVRPLERRVDANDTDTRGTSSRVPTNNYLQSLPSDIFNNIIRTSSVRDIKAVLHEFFTPEQIQEKIHSARIPGNTNMPFSWVENTENMGSIDLLDRDEIDRAASCISSFFPVGVSTTHQSP